MLTALAVLAAGPLVSVYTGPLTESLAELASWWGRITLIQIVGYGSCALAEERLLRRGRRAGPAWAPAVGELVGIVGLAVFISRFQGHVSSAEWTTDMAWWLAGITTAMIAARAGVLAGELWRTRGGSDASDRADQEPGGADRGSTPTRAWRVRDGVAAVVLGQAAYLLASRVMWQATGTQEASRAVDDVFVPGAASLANALALVLVPAVVVNRSLLRPVAARLVRTGDGAAGPSEGRHYQRGLIVPAVITIPAAVALVVCAAPLVGLLFTAKDPREVAAGAAVLACLAPTLVPSGIVALNHRVSGRLGVGGATLATVVSGALAVTVACAAAWIVRPEWATAVLALGVVAAHSLAAAYGIRLLRKRIGGVSLHPVVRAWVRILLASAGAGYVAWGVVIVLARALSSWGRVGSAVILLVAGAIFWVLYVVIARLLRIDEVAEVVGPVINRLDPRPPGRHRPRH